jgi:hypothetical protein
MLDGKPFRTVSGEMHYARVPQAQWRQTFDMAKVTGLNTIAITIFWNVLEATQSARFRLPSRAEASANDIVIFDLKRAPGRKIAGLDYPVIDQFSTELHK